jgi:peptidase M28-like protein/PDZ domain-containing protein
MTNPISLRLISPIRMRRALLHLLLISLGAAVALGQQSREILDSPAVDRLRAHITYLASDKLEGRRTGSAGANMAAEYIAREFSRYGLRRSNGYDTPGMSILEADSPRRYWQEFPYVAGAELGRSNQLRVKLVPTSHETNPSLNLQVGEDWMPLGFSTNARLENAEMAFAGYGISSAELKYDDYSISSAKDRVAIILAGTPDGDNPHGQFARAGEIRFKVAAARAAGVRALMIIAAEPSLKDEKLARLAYDNAGEAGIPVLVVSRKAAAAILGGEDGLAAYAKIADARTSVVNGNQHASGAGLPNNTSTAVVTRFPVAGVKLSLTTDVVRREVPATNVVGILPGSDPKLKNETIVIGGHYDHLGRGGEGSLAPREGEIHHGADDNASGVAGVLELARIFSAQHPRPKRTIVFIAFSGEEEGLLGSNYYINHPIVPLAQTVAMINMDMIGRMKNNNLIVGGVGTAPEWRSLIESENQMQGLTINASSPSGEVGNRPPAGVPLVVGANGRTIVSSNLGKNFSLTLNEDGFGPSDHSSFYIKQVPVLFFWTGTHDDYHKPSDTADKINYEGEARILSFVARVVQDIDKNDKRPVYAVAKNESTGRSMGFRVYLGTIPNYADSSEGLLLDGVRDDSPAAKAGLKAGDRIVKLAGREVKNVYDYTYALGEMKAGQEYEVEVVRGSERLSLRITPGARK